VGAKQSLGAWFLCWVYVVLFLCCEAKQISKVKVKCSVLCGCGGAKLCGCKVKVLGLVLNKQAK
jgi:hypothetical protein